jgi:hypothetical protein
MVLQVDEAQVEARFVLFGDRANLDALCLTYHRLENHFGCTQWCSEVTRLKRKLVSVCLEIVLILMQDRQDRCTVCAKCTIGSEIVLDAPNGTSR